MTKTTTDSSQVIVVNPEYASLVPKISDSQYKEIKQDIQEHGQHVPIIINQKGEILDGLTRNRICQELEIETRTMLCSSEYEDPLLAKQFIININRNRRQLDTFQRIELEYKLEPIEAQLARRRQSEAGGDKKSDHSIQNYTKRSEEQKKGRVIDIAAKRAQVSPMTYFKGRELIKKESPEILEKLRTGKLKIDKVYGRRVKQEKRQQLIEEAKKVAGKLPEGFKLIPGDMREECKGIADSSIDCIFTDPPYNLESLLLYKDLGKMAFRVLKEGGSLLTIGGHYALPQIFDYMKDSGLTYRWAFAVIHTGASTRMHGQQVFVTWKPLLWFVKGSKLRTHDFVRDSVESHPPDKSLQEWAQSPVEAEYYIKYLTVPNQVVLDPFLGSGTTGVAAINLKRQFIGIEIDPKRFEVAKANLERASQPEGEVSA
jgi:site-specific DNA-methyltransferase (adenine-specific)